MSKQPFIDNFFNKIESPAKKAPESSSSDETKIAGPSTASQPAFSGAGPRGGARPSSQRRKRGPPKGLGTSEPRLKRKHGSSLDCEDDLKASGHKRKTGKENESSTTNQMPKQEEQPSTDSEEATFHVKVDMPKIGLQGFHKIVAPRDQPILEALQADPRLKKIKKKLPKVYLYPDDKNNTIKGVPNIASPCSVIEGGRFQAVEEKAQSLSKYNDIELKCSERYKIYLDMRHRQSKSKWLTKKDTNILLIDCLPNDTLLSALLRDGRIIQSRVKFTKLCFKGSAEEINIKLTEKCCIHHDKVFTNTVLNDAQVSEEEWRDAIAYEENRISNNVPCSPIQEVGTSGSEMGVGDKDPQAVRVNKVVDAMISGSQAQAKKLLKLDFETKESKDIEKSRKDKLYRFSYRHRQNYFSANRGTRVLLMRQLNDVASSVGIVVKDDHPYGTCFRVGSRYVMTNRHVTQMAGLDVATTGSGINAFVEFNYMQTFTVDQERVSFQVLRVMYIGQDELDYSVLELNVPDDQFHSFQQRLPGLGHLIAPALEGKTVTLIGHPNCGPKEYDTSCPFVSPENTKLAFYVNYNPGAEGDQDCDYSKVEYPGRVTYRSVFRHGSSGSPGFDEVGNLVVMHTCGFPLHGESVLEQGVRLTAIKDDLEKHQPADFCNDLFPPPPERMEYD